MVPWYLDDVIDYVTATGGAVFRTKLSGGLYYYPPFEYSKYIKIKFRNGIFTWKSSSHASNGLSVVVRTCSFMFANTTLLRDQTKK